MRGSRGKANRSISPAVIVHTAQRVEQQSDTNQLIQQLAQEMAQALLQQQQVQPAQNKRNTLTVKEALEEVFENSISEYKLYAMLRAGEIPHVKIGAKYSCYGENLWKCG
ncbi:hypothetical protein QIH01_23290 [Brevibacillus brevis]|nr:hypothetical protein QIH01_23290 [Brevibacillus brevis]